MNQRLLTVIGSCRVYQPLLHSDLVLAQQEVPAYTHNTNEVLQLLQLYAKGSPQDDVLEQITCIPRGFQGFDVIPVPERFFVVEISSIRLLSYLGWSLQINRFFAFCTKFSSKKMSHASFHSEAELKQALYECPGLPLHIGKLGFREQEPEELMVDLRQIYHLLQGQVLFVSHFNADENGAPIWQRSQIISCLRRLHAETGVAIFDPTPSMLTFGIDKAWQNQGHYTPAFEAYIQQLLQTRLQELVPNLKKKQPPYVQAEGSSQ